MVDSGSLATALNANKILVVGPAWVGDMVMAQSLFMTLKQRHPDALIDVLAPAWSFELLKRMPEVHSAVPLPFTHGEFAPWRRLKLGRSLKSNPAAGGVLSPDPAEPSGYGQAIVLPNSWKSALIPFFADIPLRTGYVGEGRWGLLNDARKLDKERLTMTVQRFVSLGLPAESPLPPLCPSPRLSVDAESQRRTGEKFGISAGGDILALCPGAEYGPAKRWPAGYFAEVARQKHRQGCRVWLFGSGKDLAVAEEINALAGGVCQNFAGKTTLGEAMDLLSLSSAVLTNDSGLMHVAAALDKKLIAIYGSSDPGFTPPLHERAVIIDLKLDCSPCFQRECPLGHSRCLTDITPASVLAALDD